MKQPAAPKAPGAGVNYKTLLLALTLVHFDQLFHGRCILGLFLLLSKCDKPWKAQRISRLISYFSSAMDGRTGDFICQHFDDNFRLEPHAWFNQREDAGWLVIDYQPFSALLDTAPFFIG